MHVSVTALLCKIHSCNNPSAWHNQGYRHNKQLRAVVACCIWTTKVSYLLQYMGHIFVLVVVL